MNLKNIKKIPVDIQEKLTDWTKFYNEKMNKENLTLTTTNFKNIMEKFHPDLLKNECALENIILNLIGLNLKVDQNNIIDFELSVKLLEKYIDIMKNFFLLIVKIIIKQMELMYFSKICLILLRPIFSRI